MTESLPIEKYNIKGAEGLIEAIQESLRYFVRYENTSGSDKNDTHRELIEEVIEVIDRVVNVIRTVWPKAISESGLLALPPVTSLLT